MVDVAAFLDLFRATAVALVGTATLAGLVSVLSSATYRGVTTRAAPDGVVPLVALGTVTGYLTGSLLVTGRLVEGVPPDHHYSAGFLLGTVLCAGSVAVACDRLGDRLACQITGRPPLTGDGDATDALRSARLAVVCAFPESIESLTGYRAVDAETRESIADTTVRLPHGLSTQERRDRLERYLERADGVDVATVELAADGTISRVAVGARATGLGSVLPPETVAVAIRTERPPAGGRGDAVECWSTDDQPQLVATGTLHSTIGSVATVLLDPDRVGDLSQHDSYRLVTGPDAPADGHALAGTLRTVDETVVAWTVDDALAGEFVGWLPGRVLVIAREDEGLAMPAASETLQPGDRLWMLATPDALGTVDHAGEHTGTASPADDDRTAEREPSEVEA